jgi:propanol-preferring alcohol dehydrogenase
MVLERTCSLLEDDHPLRMVEIAKPVPGRHEVLLEVTACGVCHTELDEIEGRAPPPRLPVVLGHEVVGRVVALGIDVDPRALGERVGVGWIHSSSGGRDENVSPEFRATGRDVNGGYAEYMCVPYEYAYRLPDTFSDVAAAPLLCAGAIGYRALRLTGIRDGDALGLTGFGGSAHLVLQLSKFLYPHTPVYVFARGEQTQSFAAQLGADWVGAIGDRTPIGLSAVIDTTPAWLPVVEALVNLKPGGRLVINAIRKEDGDKDKLLDLDYGKHLWMEKEIKSVANITHFDIREFLEVAGNSAIRVEVETYLLEDANQALVSLKRHSTRGAKVLTIR